MNLSRQKRMSKRNARTAGVTFLLYYATALGEMFLYRKASSGEGIAPKLASIAQHAPQVRLTVVFALLTILYALVLAVTLYALTRDVDRDIALLAFTCRVVEGVINAVPATARLGLLSIATAGASAAAGEAVVLQAPSRIVDEDHRLGRYRQRDDIRRRQYVIRVPVPARPQHSRSDRVGRPYRIADRCPGFLAAGAAVR